jgi:diacylglycerol O-acyltransferase / wax synthase
LVCLTDGLGLGHVVQSYCSEATISFTACRNLMPDPEFYAQCIEDSFQELLAAAREKGQHSDKSEKPVGAQKPKKPGANKKPDKLGKVAM